MARFANELPILIFIALWFRIKQSRQWKRTPEHHPHRNRSNCKSNRVQLSLGFFSCFSPIDKWFEDIVINLSPLCMLLNHGIQVILEIYLISFKTR